MIYSLTEWQLKIQASTIPNAGKGLFAMIQQGNLMKSYLERGPKLSNMANLCRERENDECSIYINL